VRLPHSARTHWSDPLYRQSYLMLASTGVAAGTGLLFWVVAAHRVAPEVLGLAAGLFAANAFLSYLTGFALPYAMLRFGAVDDGVSARLNASLHISAVTSVVAALAFGFAAPVVSPELASYVDGGLDLVLFALAGVGAAASVLVDNLLAARRRAGIVLARNAVAGLLKLAPLAVLSRTDPRGLYLAVTLPSLITVAVLLFALPRLVPGYRLLAPYGGDPAVRELADFAWRNTPGSLLSGAPQFALPLIAVNVLGAHRNAFFHVAWSLSQIAYLVPSVVSNIALSQGTAGTAGETARRALRFALLLLVPALPVVVAPGWLLALYGARYGAEAADPLRLLLVGAVPWSVVIVVQARLRTEHRFGTLTALTGTFCGAALAVPVLAAYRWGVGGMAAGWLAAVGSAAALSWWRAERGPVTRVGPVR
jgi:O-antigen/teichoic acid export membrane protein